MKLFVSYSHKDGKWLDRLRVHLTPLAGDDLELWDDRSIPPGAIWRDEISSALASSEGALLLVSADFLASPFIVNDELPEILRQANERGTKVLPIVVGQCLFRQSTLGRFEALNDPERPIADQRRPTQDRILKEAAEQISKFLNTRLSRKPTPTRHANGPGIRIPPAARIAVSLNDELMSEMIRVSVSGLFRIRSSDKFLLVRGHRIDQFQPVGGVLKRWPSASRTLDPLGVRDDDKIRQDADSTGDLRVQVPGRSLIAFLNWYRSETNRETHPWREFHEELLATQILPSSEFPYMATERIGTYVSGVGWSVHLQCWEMLISEIFETYPNHSQATALAKLQQTEHVDVRWASKPEILSRGVIPPTRLVADIADNAAWFL